MGDDILIIKCFDHRDMFCVKNENGSKKTNFLPSKHSIPVIMGRNFSSFYKKGANTFKEIKELNSKHTC